MTETELICEWETISDFKKGDKIIMTWGCYDDYEGMIIKNLKYKLVINTITKNGKDFIETRDFDKQYIRTIKLINKI